MSILLPRKTHGVLPGQPAGRRYRGRASRGELTLWPAGPFPASSRLVAPVAWISPPDFRVIDLAMIVPRCVSIFTDAPRPGLPLSLTAEMRSQSPSGVEATLFAGGLLLPRFDSFEDQQFVPFCRFELLGGERCRAPADFQRVVFKAIDALCKHLRTVFGACTDV